jgi:outer membrane receptor protein involved in Fe transport
MRIHACTALLAALAPDSAWAQDTDRREAEAETVARDAAGTGGTTLTYTAEFYTRFAPQHVFDMLSRTPGFVLDEGARVRGLAGGSGNVLIDGRRPSAKADGLSDALKQIPAAHVERIEIIRGAQSNELSGQTIVANIVRRADAKGSGSVAVTVERAPQGRVFPNLEANYSAPIGAWQASVSGTFMLEYHPIEGLYRLTDGSGDLVGTRRETIGERYRQETLSGALAGPVAGGTLALNGATTVATCARHRPSPALPASRRARPAAPAT